MRSRARSNALLWLLALALVAWWFAHWFALGFLNLHVIGRYSVMKTAGVIDATREQEFFAEEIALHGEVFPEVVMLGPPNAWLFWLSLVPPVLVLAGAAIVTIRSFVVRER